MNRRLAITIAIAPALFACEAVLGITKVTVEPTEADDLTPGQDAAAADAQPEAPNDDPRASRLPEDAGKAKKHVFVTSTMSNGILHGREGADAQCAVAAARGNLGGVWIAWLSEAGATTPNAVDRIPHDGPFFRLDDVPIAQDKVRLTSGTLLAPIIVTETRDVLASPPAEEARVWTGTSLDGTLSVDCSRWSTASELVFGTLGSLTATTNGQWTDNGGAAPPLFVDWGCQTFARLYCFEL